MTGREESTEHARALFESLGYVVRDIDPAPPEQRADLTAQHADEFIVIEAKARQAHAEWLQMATRARASPSRSALMRRWVKPWTGVIGEVKSAHEQLVATPAPAHAIRLVFLSLLHGDVSFVAEALGKRLLGTELLVAAEVTDGGELSAEAVTCHGYSPARFDFMPEVDGAILASAGGALLLVNPRAPGRHRLRASALHAAQGERLRIIDAEADSAAGDALLIGTDFVRVADEATNRQALHAYIRERHGLATSGPMVASEFSGILVLPRDVLEGGE